MEARAALDLAVTETWLGYAADLAQARERGHVLEGLAVALAEDPARLNALKAKLAANRATAPLFDTPRFARNLEAIYSRLSG